MRIAHIADVHIRLYKRHEEYQEVFQKLYASLRSQKVDRIALLGDIFHSKSILSPEAVELASGFFRELALIAPVDIIIGNHDVNVKNNTRLDSISPIVDLVQDQHGPQRIFVLLKSGWQHVWTSATDKVCYGIFSCIDEGNFPIQTHRDDPGAHPNVYIALFHGNLVGSIAENNYRFTDTGYDPTILFKNYDFVMLGDIHKRQQIGNAWYSGSLIQQDFGEGLEKGYLIWDTQRKPYIPEFIPIKNEYAFYSIPVDQKIDRRSIPVIPNCSSKPSIRVILKNHEYSIPEIKEIEIELKQKYNPVALEVKRDVKIEQKPSILTQTVKSAADLGTQASLIKSFLTSHDPETVNRVIDINKVVRASVNEDDILLPAVWKLKEIEWDDVLSYGQGNKVNFEKLKGLTGIFAPNRSGKSNFIDTIFYVLFNRSARVSKITRIINNQSDNCRASVTIEVDGQVYRINRKSSRTPAGGTTTKVYFEKFAGGVWKSETGDSRTDTDKIIRRLIGTFDDVIASSISPQGRISYFLDSGLEDTFRLELLTRFLGLNVFKLQHDIANKMAAETEFLLKQCKQTDYASVMKAYRDEIDKLNESLVDFEEDKIYALKQIDTLGIQIATLHAMYQDVEDDPKLTETDKSKLETMIIQLKVQRDSEEKLALDDQTRFDKIDKYNLAELLETANQNVVTLNNFNTDLNKIDSDIRVAQMSLRKDRSRVDTLGRQPWTDNNAMCQTCEFYQEADKLRRELRGIEASLLKLQSTKAELEARKIPFVNAELERTKVRDLIDEHKRLQNSIKVRRLSVEKCELQIDKYKLIIAEQDREAQKILMLKQVKDMNAEVNRLVVEKEVEKATSTKLLNQIEYSINAHTRRIAEVEQKIVQSEEGLQKLERVTQEAADFKLYLSCMHREGIPYTIISTYIDVINTQVQKIVGDYIPFGIRFSLEGDKRSIAINLVYENGTVNPIELGSGMEKMIAGIAIRAALVSISNIPKCNAFIIDESFGALDQDNLATVDRFLEHLKSMFDNVLLISHVPQLQDFVDQTITIDTSSGNSHILAV